VEGFLSRQRKRPSQVARMKDESSDIGPHAKAGAGNSKPSAILGIGSACAPKLPTCGAGFWISPAGLAVQVSPTHVGAVCLFPRKFGYTQAEVEAAYARFGDALCVEGAARREILFELIQRGWTRVRHYRNLGWTVNIGKDASAARARAVRFFVLLLAGNPGIRYDAVRLDSPSGVETTLVLDLVEGNGGQRDASATWDVRASDVRFVHGVQELPDLGDAQ